MCAKQFDHSNKEFKLLNPDKLNIACVVSEWHNEITEKLFIGAKKHSDKKRCPRKKYF
jgi:6,7-dimethyl-8-ribityllumazine synthase